jgi:uncharacterized protein
VRILSIDGGGFLGLSSAAFLAEIEHHFKKKCSDCFDFFCGTSTGAIIALGLANGLSAQDVVNHYKEIGSEIFPDRGLISRGIHNFVLGLFRPRYKLLPLKTALDRVFGDSRLSDITKRRKYALVAAFNISNGSPRIFKTDHSSDLTAHNHYRLADIALASSAAPVFFPLAELKDSRGTSELLCDGGVFANSPALMAYAEAVKELGVSPKEIEILSVSTPRASLAERSAAQRRGTNRGLLHWSMRISQVMVDGTSAASDAALQRLVSGLRRDSKGYCRIALSSSTGLALDTATPAAIESLMQIGTEEGRKSERRLEVKPFFVDGGE